MVAIAARGHGRRRARHLDVAHPRPPHEPRRRGPGHVRRRGRSCPRSPACCASAAPACSRSCRAAWTARSSDAAHAELDLLGRLAAVAGTRLTFSVVQTHTELDRWRVILDRSGELRDAGRADLPAGGEPRHRDPVRAPEQEQRVLHPAQLHRASPTLPLADRLARMRDPEVRARILAEPNGEWDHPLASFVYETFSNMLPVREPHGVGTDARPTPWPRSPSARAVRRRRSSTTSSPRATVATWCMFPFTNYFHFSLDDVHDMLEHPASVWGLGDGGAHCGAAVDSSGPDAHAHALGARPRRAARASTCPPRCGG